MLQIALPVLAQTGASLAKYWQANRTHTETMNQIAEYQRQIDRMKKQAAGRFAYNNQTADARFRNQLAAYGDNPDARGMVERSYSSFMGNNADIYNQAMSQAGSLLANLNAQRIQAQNLKPSWGSVVSTLLESGAAAGLNRYMLSKYLNSFNNQRGAV